MKYAFIFLTTILFVLCLVQRKQINTLKATNQQKIDSIQHIADSLYADNYPCQIELNRYQVAYRIFIERNPKAAEQYGTIISDETE